MEWDSPTWHAGVRARQLLLTINGEPVTTKILEQLQKEKKAGDIVHLQVLQDGVIKDIPFMFATKYERPFTITRIKNPTALQGAILKDWLRGK